MGSILYLMRWASLLLAVMVAAACAPDEFSGVSGASGDGSSGEGGSAGSAAGKAHSKSDPAEGGAAGSSDDGGEPGTSGEAGATSSSGSAGDGVAGAAGEPTAGVGGSQGGSAGAGATGGADSSGAAGSAQGGTAGAAGAPACPVVGSITFGPDTFLADGDTFTLEDGIYDPVVFEFDLDATPSVEPYRVPVPLVGTEDSAQLAWATATAVNWAYDDGLIRISAAQDGSVVRLTGDLGCTPVPIRDTVGNPQFQRSGMAAALPPCAQ